MRWKKWTNPFADISVASMDATREAAASGDVKAQYRLGMCYKEGDTLISTAVAVNKEDAAAIRELVQMGIKVEIQKTPADNKGDAIAALDAKGL